MRTYIRLPLGALAAAFALACAVGVASAGRISVSSQTFRQVWTPLGASTESGGSGTTVACNMTLEGSFHYRSILKQARSLVGYITKAAIGHPCTGGEAFFLNGIEKPSNTLPWHLTYEGFEGTLPNITGVRLLLRSALLVQIIGIPCLYEGNVQDVLKLSRGVVTGLVPDSTVPKLKVSGGVFCPPSLFYWLEPSAGDVFTALNSATSVTITLI